MHVRDRTGESLGRALLHLELTDAAFAVTSRYDVKGPAADQKRDLWKALGPVVREGEGDADRSAEATDAAYRVALARGFRGSFLDLELELWRDFRRVFRASGPGAGRRAAYQPSA
jgi:hypothetical protein